MGELKIFGSLLSMDSNLLTQFLTDFNSRWDKKTGHNAPLRARPNEDENNKVLNDEFAINYLIQLGAIPEKTNLGIPLYGRAFLLKNKDNNDMDAKARETSFSGPITREQGFLGYNEICKMLTSPSSQWSIVWEKCHQVPYMFNQDKWVGYDNERSIRLKADFAWEKRLGGVMVWSIETDDFKGFCGPHKFPLMRALNNELVRKTKSLETYDQDVEKCSIENYSTERTIVTLAPPTTTTTTPQPVTSSGNSENLSDGSEEEDGDGSGSGDDDYDEDEEEEDVGPCHHNPNGPNPDPSECSQFYLCAGGKAHLMTCRDGTLYSAALMTCDHAANVECKVKKTTTRRTTTTRGLVFLSTSTSEKTTTIVTLSTVTKLTTKSTSTVVTTTKSTTILVTSPSTTPVSTTTTTKKYERQTEIVPIRINPVKEEDIVPLQPVDNDINDDKIDTRFSSDYNPNSRPHHGKLPVNYDVNNNLDHHGRDHSYQFSKSMESQDINKSSEEEEGMEGEKVAIIILVLILLVVILIFMWCFRSRIRDLTETYLDKIAADRIRKPSTVSLLKAYQLNKIKFPSYSGKMEDSRVHPTTTTTPTAQLQQQPPLPKLPPKDYSSRDLPPLPLNERAPIAPPRRKKSFSEGSFSENLYESPNLTQSSSPSPNGTSLTLT